MIYSKLAFEFFKVGLLSFGGGYATIPFLYYISEKYNWYSILELSKMIAIASVTPGPVGINVATYAGLKSAGIIGAILATISIILPSLILVILVAKLLKRFQEDEKLRFIIDTLKPISCALLASVAIGMASKQIKDLNSLILLIIFVLISWKSKKNPLFYIIISAIVFILMEIF